MQQTWSVEVVAHRREASVQKMPKMWAELVQFCQPGSVNSGHYECSLDQQVRRVIVQATKEQECMIRTLKFGHVIGNLNSERKPNSINSIQWAGHFYLCCSILLVRVD